MKIVIDTNLVFSSLINPSGKIAELILDPFSKTELYSCYYLYIELFDHKEKLKKLSGFTEKELLDVMYSVLKRIHFVNEFQIPSKIWGRSTEITKSVDPKDTGFVALAKHLDIPLWTGDKKLHLHFRKNKYIEVLNTTELRGKMFS